jgi:hypothetical protein
MNITPERENRKLIRAQAFGEAPEPDRASRSCPLRRYLDRKPRAHPRNAASRARQSVALAGIALALIRGGAPCLGALPKTGPQFNDSTQPFLRVRSC